jgi:hypothetical protein
MPPGKSAVGFDPGCLTEDAKGAKGSDNADLSKVASNGPTPWARRIGTLVNSTRLDIHALYSTQPTFNVVA